MKLSMNHSAIIVGDLDRSIEFYKDILELELLFTGTDDGSVSRALGFPDAGMRYANFKIDGGEIELLEFTSMKGDPCQCSPNQSAKMHICFEVEDIELVVQELADKGVRFWTPVVEIEEDPLFKGSKFVYFSDPDGAQLELLELPD